MVGDIVRLVRLRLAKVHGKRLVGLRIKMLRRDHMQRLLLLQRLEKTCHTCQVANGIIKLCGPLDKISIKNLCLSNRSLHHVVISRGVL